VFSMCVQITHASYGFVVPYICMENCDRGCNLDVIGYAIWTLTDLQGNASHFDLWCCVRGIVV